MGICQAQFTSKAQPVTAPKRYLLHMCSHLVASSVSSMLVFFLQPCSALQFSPMSFVQLTCQHTFSSVLAST